MEVLFDDFLTFVRNLHDEAMSTVRGRADFRVQIVEGALVYTNRH